MYILDIIGGKIMQIKSCCLIVSNEIGEEEAYYLAERLREEIKKALQKGYTNFISSFENTIDLIFADIVVELMNEFPHITLEAAISNSSKLENADFLFNRLLNKCKTVGVTSIEHDNCTAKRNRLMVDFSQLIIIINNDNETNDLIIYAKSLKKEIIII